jgi:hypothetical protein
MTMKTLSFQKETVRALVSVELDSIVGGVSLPSGRTSMSSSALNPTDTLVLHTGRTSMVTHSVSSALKPTATSVSSAIEPTTFGPRRPANTANSQNSAL